MDPTYSVIVTIIILIIFVILINYYVKCNDNNKEHMASIYEPSTIIPQSLIYSPFWNSTRHTRNMSWDIKGDVPIRYDYQGPFWHSNLI